MNEYHVTNYIQGAWKKLLEDPAFRINPKASNEPHLPHGVTIKNPIAPPVAMPDVRSSMLLASPFEEIIDPSHPFSPRWDYEDNERDMFAKQGATVFCAGDKDKNVIKVDILSFRDERINFKKNVQDRVDFNKNCKANAGLQKNPCCKVIPIPLKPPHTWPCIPQPCSVCFRAIGDQQPCATSYTEMPDRKYVVPPFLPVNPILRMSGMMTNVQNQLTSIDLSTFPKNINVGQVKAMVGSMQNIVNTVAPNIPLSSMLGQLNGYLSIAGDLQNMAAKVGATNIGLLMNAQGEVFSNMGNTQAKLGEISALMSSQAKILSQMPPGLKMGQYASYLQAPAKMLETMNALGPNMTIKDAAPMLKAQSNILTGFPATATIGQTLGQLSNVGTTLKNVQPLLKGMENMNFDKATEAVKAQATLASSFTQSTRADTAKIALQAAGDSLIKIADSTPISALGASYTAKIPGLASLKVSSNTMTVGQLRQSIGAQIQNLASMPPNVSMGQVASDVTAKAGQMSQISIQIPGIGKLTTQMTPASIEKLVSTQVASFKNLNPNDVMGTVAPIMDKQLNSMINLPGGMKLDLAQQFARNQTFSFDKLKNLEAAKIGSGIQSQVYALTGKLDKFDPAKLGTMFLDQGKVIDKFQGLAIGNIQNTMTNYLNKIIPMAQVNNAIQAGQLASALGHQFSQLQGLNELSSMGSVAGSFSSFANLGQAVSSGKLTLGMIWAFPYLPIAACTPAEPLQNATKMADMCREIRAPLVPINKLKMRYHDPAKLSESELPSGVPEGLTFKEYFGSNMPYMRLLDTGRPIQKSRSAEQDPMDNLGQYTAIVGVGKEAISGNANAKDQRCLLGGWGGPSSFGGVSVDAPDPVTSWTELKLYQARTARKDGVYCIGRYDKVFKPESTEEKILSLAGGDFNVLSALPGETKKTNISKVSWPLAWRGYLMEPDAKFRFPNFSMPAKGIYTGLDNAKPGDILILPENGSDAGRPPGLARLAIVMDDSNNSADCETMGSCWVSVKVADDGNAPDICGTTDAMGQALTRTFFKPGYSKNLNQEHFKITNSSTDCEDQNLQKCILNTWDKINVYRIREDRQTP
ncbi:MAG: hypothetical protein ACK5VT_07335 [Alphaproteobacteria bacterium]